MYGAYMLMDPDGKNKLGSGFFNGRLDPDSLGMGTVIEISCEYNGKLMPNQIGSGLKTSRDRICKADGSGSVKLR